MKAVNNRLLELDSIRGIATLLVMAYHYTTRFQELYYQPNPLAITFSLGHYGVQLFFLISGFVIFMTLEKTKDYKDFIVSRFARLYPAYWVAVTLTAVFVWIFSLPNRETSLAETLINLTMLQQLFSVPHVDGVYWTLTIELSFYAIMAVLLISGQLKNIVKVGIVWMSAMLITFITENTLKIEIPGIIKSVLLLDYANFFLSGIFFYKIYAQKDNISKLILLIGLGILTEFIIHGIESGLIALLLVFFFGVVVTQQTKSLNKIISFRLLVQFGTISYSLYLLHQNIGYILLRAFYENNFSPQVAIPLTMFIAIILATGLNLLIEKPANKAIRAYWQAQKQ